jgi:hypothetical protein
LRVLDDHPPDGADDGGLKASPSVVGAPVNRPSGMVWWTWPARPMHISQMDVASGTPSSPVS